MNKHRFNNGTQHVEEIRLTPGITEEFQQAAANAVESFEASDYTKTEDGEKAVAAYIVVHENDARIAYGVDPATGGLGYAQPEGSEIILQSTEEIEAFRWINDTADEQVTLTVTFYFRN